MVPNIIVDSDGKVIMISGASGGNRITLSVSWVRSKNLCLSDHLKKLKSDPHINVLRATTQELNTRTNNGVNLSEVQ